MTRLARLRREARRACKDREHRLMRHWFGNDIGGRLREWTFCLNCGKEVTVIPNPMPNEIEISGEAVALNCRLDRYCKKCGQSFNVHNDDGSCVAD